MSHADHSGSRCDCTRPANCIDRQPGRYLTALYRLEEDMDRRVRTGELGDSLGVRPASVTEMIRKLAAEGLVAHENHGGVELTEAGSRIARELAARQSAVRAFFAAETGSPFDPETGYRIGYVLPAAGIERLRELADDPGATAGEGGERPARDDFVSENASGHDCP